MPEMPLPHLTLRALRACAVDVPMTYVLGTSAAAVRSAPLLLVDLETEEGVEGHAYLFCYRREAAPAIVAILAALSADLRGTTIVPADLWATLSRRYRLIGVQGIVRMAMAALDVAAWDALSRAAKLPLARMLGGAPQKIPAYNSCGLGLMPPGPLADEAEKLLAGGFKAVKLRLGYATLEEDLAAVRAVRRRIGDSVALMVDYNQALDRAEALRRCRALDGEGLYWIEEPIRHDDYAGYALLAEALKTPVQIGENFSEVTAMAASLEAGASTLVMPDLERIGGVTGWQRAAALAAAHKIPMSSHLFPEVSAHLLSVTPTAHWLEYMDWANAIVEEPLAIVDGYALACERPGNGLEWRRGAVERYRFA